MSSTEMPDNAESEVTSESTHEAVPDSPPEKSSSAKNEQVNLLNVPIKTENDALNALIGFLSLAQRRGTFAINESAKIFECVKIFKH